MTKGHPSSRLGGITGGLVADESGRVYRSREPDWFGMEGRATFAPVKKAAENKGMFGRHLLQSMLPEGEEWAVASLGGRLSAYVDFGHRRGRLCCRRQPPSRPAIVAAIN